MHYFINHVINNNNKKLYYTQSSLRWQLEYIENSIKVKPNLTQHVFI